MIGSIVAVRSGHARFRRVDRSPAAEWWWTVDRVNVGLMLLLCAAGTVAVTAAGGAVADTVGMAFRGRFALKHLLFTMAAVALMLRISLMTPRGVRMLGICGFALTWPMLALTPLIGTGIKGARRWLYLGPVHLQPSEFIKPALVILVARLFAAAVEYRTFPGRQAALVVLLITLTPLLMQPDVGQTLLIGSVWLAMFFISGAHVLWFVSAAAAAVPAALALYVLHPHVRRRVDDFLFNDNPDIYGSAYQIVKAKAALYSGGWWGKGPGEGVVKQLVPDAHSDYIFAVIGEEFGLIACMLPMLCYVIIVYRSLRAVLLRPDPFAVPAVVGLSLLLGLQAFINMAVNLGMIPPKGMTLPFVSYGGSSSLAVGLTAGMLLALTRRRVGTDAF